jgi:hypothetical protein
MTDETKLMIQNQMITNNLLMAIALLAADKAHGQLALKCVNNLGAASDDMTKAKLALDKLNN